MKNIIEYYYHFASISLHYSNGVYFFEKNNTLYLLREVKRPLDEIRQIYQLLINRTTNYHKILLNKDGNIITIIDQRPYVLMQVQMNNQNIITIDNLLAKEELVIDRKSFSMLYRTNWQDLWSQKIDYLEYQMNHIEKKYPLLSSSLYYYIGLAENAISYAEDTKLHEKKELKDSECISHIRMYSSVTQMDYVDPFSIIIDHKARDVAGYLKSIFFEDIYEEEKIVILLQNLSFSKYGYRILMSRMLYPSYYFDVYEQIILGLKEEKAIKKIIKQSEAYRAYIKMIYRYINEIVEIPRIEWL